MGGPQGRRRWEAAGKLDGEERRGGKEGEGAAIGEEGIGQKYCPMGVGGLKKMDYLC